MYLYAYNLQIVNVLPLITLFLGERRTRVHFLYRRADFMSKCSRSSSTFHLNRHLILVSSPPCSKAGLVFQARTIP